MVCERYTAIFAACNPSALIAGYIRIMPSAVEQNNRLFFIRQGIFDITGEFTAYVRRVAVGKFVFHINQANCR